MKPITEDKIETFALEVLQSMGWEYVHGLMLAPGADKAERELGWKADTTLEEALRTTWQWQKYLESQKKKY